MTTVKQLPTPVDVEVVAGDPFAVTFTATSGVTTFASPAVTVTTAAGDAYTTDPGLPVASAASAVLTCAWSAADTAALITGTRAKVYKYSVEATADGGGPYQIFGGTLTVHPVGTTGTGTSATQSASLTLGGAAVTATVALGGGGGGGGGSTTLVVQEGDVTVVAAADTLDFGAGFDVTESPSGEANITLDLAEYTGGALPVAAGGTGASTAAGARSALGVDAAGTAAAAVAAHEALSDPHPTYTTAAELSAALASYLTTAAAAAGYQPLDSDLTAIAALSTTSFGRALLTLADAAAARSSLGVVIGTDVAAQSSLASYQPLDSDLTAIAALSTTSFGRSLLALADAAAARSSIGVDAAGTAASAVSAHESDTTNVHGITDTSTLYRSGGTDVAVADGGTGASTAANARTNLGLAIGTDVQAYDAELAAIAGLTSAANKVPYFTGSGTAALADFSAAGRALVDDADATAQRTTLGLGTIATQASSSVSITGGSVTGITDLAVADGGTGASTAANARTNLGLVIGTDVAAQSSLASYLTTAAAAAGYQPLDSDLTAIAALTSAANKVPYATGAGTWALTDFSAAGRALVDDADAAAQRTTLGLGTIATQASSSVSVTGGTITGITDLAVADGGTGASTAANARTNLDVQRRLWRAEINASAWQATAVGAWVTGATGMFTYFSAVSDGTQNASIDYTVDLSPGTWSLKFFGYRGPGLGIATIKLDGTTIGTIDLYAAASAAYDSTITGITVSTDGAQTLQVVMATKNASSSGYQGNASWFTMWRTA